MASTFLLGMFFPPLEIVNYITKIFCPRLDLIWDNFLLQPLGHSYIHHPLPKHLSNNDSFLYMLLLREAKYSKKKSGRHISKYYY